MKLKKPPFIVPQITIIQRIYKKDDYENIPMEIEGIYFHEETQTLKIWVRNKETK